jgi:hypothetical protein
MATFMKVIGLTIKLRVEELMSIWMALNILVTGKKIDNMDMELKHGQMVQNMKVIMNLERNME